MSTIPDHMERVEKQAVAEIIEHVLKVQGELARPDGTAYGDVILDTPEERVMWYMDLASRPSPEFNILTFLPDIDELARTSQHANFVGLDAQGIRDQFERDAAEVEFS